MKMQFEHTVRPEEHLNAKYVPLKDLAVISAIS
jgi:hypothetical protein